MKKVLFTLMIGVISVTLWTWQLEGNMQNVALERMKNGVNRAAHAALLQTIDEEYADGYLIFDQDEAMKKFKETLKRNMQLDDNLEAIEGSLFSGKMEIVWHDFIDDYTVLAHPFVDSNTPFDGHGKVYRYEDPEGNFVLSDTIFGPSVAFVIKARKPLEVGDSETYIYHGAIYEHMAY